MIYSYTRVSTNKQDYLRQDEAIKKWCADNNVEIDVSFSDTITGKTFNRDGYNRMKQAAVSGDTIIIKELDRLGRDWDGIKEEWKYFDDKDINIVVIDMPLLSQAIYDKDGNIDLNIKFLKAIVFETLCYNAELERQKNSRRTSEKLQAMKAEGIKLGRPINTEADKTVCELYAQGMNKSDIAFYAGVSRPQVYAILKRNHLM